MTDSQPTLRTYCIVAAVLAVLLVVTVVAAYLPLGQAGVVVALAIAATKAGLVAMYFMHVRYESPMIRLCAASGLLWLAILFWLTLADYLTR